MFASAFVGANFCFSTGSLRVQSKKRRSRLSRLSSKDLSTSLPLNAWRYEKFLHYGKVPPQIAPTNAVMDSLFKTVSPTVRAVARRSIISKGSEGIEIEQTRLRPSPKRKSSKERKGKQYHMKEVGFSREKTLVSPLSRALW